MSNEQINKFRFDYKASIKFFQLKQIMKVCNSCSNDSNHKYRFGLNNGRYLMIHVKIQMCALFLSMNQIF